MHFTRCSLLWNQSPAEKEAEVWDNLGHLGVEKRRVQMYYEPDFCSKHLGFFSEEIFQKFPDLCWNIVLQRNPLAAFSQPRKFHSQFSHILLWIPGSERERKRGSTTKFFPRKKDGNIVLQHLKTCTQCQPEKKN